MFRRGTAKGERLRGDERAGDGGGFCGARGCRAPTISAVRAQAVEREGAATASFQGRTYYFCSQGCRREFLEDPAKFLGEAAAGPA